MARTMAWPFLQGRANQFLVEGGGVFQNLGPLTFQGPLKKSFATQHFPENFIIQRTNPSVFTNFAIPACQGPLPASWAPFSYTFFWGGVTISETLN
jgi:hypothetical protein